MRLDGSELDFGAFYVKYAPLVRRMLVRRGVRHGDLDDVLQDAFVTIDRLLPEFEGRSSVETWLHSVTWRVAANHFRSARRNSEIPSDPAVSFIVDGPAPGASPNERVHATLGQLDEQQRDLVVLHEVGEFSISELSRLTGNARGDRSRSARSWTQSARATAVALTHGRRRAHVVGSVCTTERGSVSVHRRAEPSARGRQHRDLYSGRHRRAAGARPVYGRHARGRDRGDVCRSRSISRGHPPFGGHRAGLGGARPRSAPVDGLGPRQARTQDSRGWLGRRGHPKDVVRGFRPE
jgi:RNA polymerase sigma-70 factor, ECF subfamily